MRILALLSFALVLAQTAIADYCVSALAMEGLNRKQCNNLMVSFRDIEKPCVAYLYKSFRRNLKADSGFFCPSEFAKKYSDREHVIQVYIDNPTCRRAGRRCDKTREIFPSLSSSEYSLLFEQKDIATLDTYASRVSSLLIELLWYGNSNTNFILVPGLEDDLSNQAYKNKISIIKKMVQASGLPRVTYVRNANAKTSDDINFRGSHYLELHGLQPEFNAIERCSYSNDGYDLDFGSGYKPLPSRISMRSAKDIFEGFAARGCRVLLWWNTQGITSKFILPYRRSYIVRRKDNIVVNTILKDLQNENY